MSNKMYRLLFPVFITITLFSLWAGFALLIVNKLFYKDLPGYTIGRICIWELVAIIIAGIIAKLIVNRWGNIELKEVGDRSVLIIDRKYGIYFTIYFIILILIAIWQFWLFSQKF